nr:uncharacterized mitochondrial protein AtMg00810-like [Tanacetum cinerariifolium]
MDFKSDFLYGKIENEVYLFQLPGFEDSDFPDKVYKVEKALYGLHQAPTAWYETLSTYLMDNGFHRGQIDKTLFIKRHKDDIILVQVYVDDIIFGSTKKELSTEFEKLMHDRFQMSSIGELSFFLGLQVQQKSDGIFINQEEYMAGILKKFNFTTMKTASTPMEPNKALVSDAEAKDIEVHLYGLMIGSLMYLIAPRPDITFAVCACVRFQVTPKTSHLHVVKRIFKYLKRQPKLGFWYPRDSPFDLEAYSNSDYAGASLDRKTTSGGCQFLGKSCHGQVLSIQNQMLDYRFNLMNTKIYIDNESTICIVKNPFWTSAKVKTVNDDVRLQALVDGKRVIVNEASVRRDLRLDDAEGTACLPNDAIFEGSTRMGYEKPSQKLTFYKTFFSPQWKFLIHTILQCLIAKTTAWNEFSSTMAYAIICLTNNQKFNFSKYILENMVKNLEAGVKFYMFPRFVQVFINHQLGDMSHHKGIFVNPSLTEKVFANMKRVGTGFSGVITPLFETMMRKHKPRKKQREATEIPHTEPQAEEKYLHLPMIHYPLTNQAAEIEKLKKRVKKLEGKKKKRTHGLKRLYKGRIAKIDANEDLFLIDKTTQDQGRIKDQDLFGVHDLDGDEVFVDVTTGKNVEHNATVAESVEGIAVATTSQISKDELTLAQTLMEIKAAKPKAKGVTVQEPSEFRTTLPPQPSQPPHAKDNEVARNLEAEMKAEIKEEERIEREKNETNRAMIEEWDDDLSKRTSKEKIFDDIKKMVDNVYKRVNTFVDMNTENVEESPKKTQPEANEGKLKRCLEIVPEDDDDVAIKATPLSSKSSNIVDYKIYREWKKSYFKIIKADGNSQNYLTFGTMFKNFNREDLEVLRSIVKERFKKKKPVDTMDNLLFQTLKTMFEHHVEGII